MCSVGGSEQAASLNPFIDRFVYIHPALTFNNCLSFLAQTHSVSVAGQCTSNKLYGVQPVIGRK